MKLECLIDIGMEDSCHFLVSIIKVSSQIIWIKYSLEMAANHQLQENNCIHSHTFNIK